MYFKCLIIIYLHDTSNTLPLLYNFLKFVSQGLSIKIDF